MNDCSFVLLLNLSDLSFVTKKKTLPYTSPHSELMVKLVQDFAQQFESRLRYPLQSAVL